MVYPTACSLISLQKTAARLVSNKQKYEHIGPALRDLHRLSSKRRIEFKILLLTFKCTMYVLNISLMLYTSRKTRKQELMTRPSLKFRKPRSLHLATEALALAPSMEHFVVGPNSGAMLITVCVDPTLCKDSYTAFKFS